jgi:hypothetical protein
MDQIAITGLGSKKPKNKNGKHYNGMVLEIF